MIVCAGALPDVQPGSHARPARRIYVGGLPGRHSRGACFNGLTARLNSHCDASLRAKTLSHVVREPVRSLTCYAASSAPTALTLLRVPTPQSMRHGVS